MEIYSRDDYHFVNGQFVLKSRFTKTIKFGIAVGLIIGGLFATIPQTTATTSQHEKYTWTLTKSKYTNYIQNSNKEVNDKDAASIVASVFKWSTHFDIPPEIIFAVAKVESRFDKHAISSSGAMGLMQVLYKVHLDKIVQAKNEIGNPEIFDIDSNIYTGTKILKYCLSKFKFDSGLDKCYNGGLDGNGYAAKVAYEMKQLKGTI